MPLKVKVLTPTVRTEKEILEEKVKKAVEILSQVADRCDHYVRVAKHPPTADWAHWILSACTAFNDIIKNGPKKIRDRGIGVDH